MPIVEELAHAMPSEVVGVVAKTIGLGTDSTTNLVAACEVALGAQRCLLVLDNCDRVTGVVADPMGGLLVLAAP